MRGDSLCKKVFSILKKAVEYISERITVKPNIAIVLGSGLGALAKRLTLTLRSLTVKLKVFQCQPFPDTAASLSSEGLAVSMWFVCRAECIFMKVTLWNRL